MTMMGGTVIGMLAYLPLSGRPALREAADKTGVVLDIRTVAATP